MPGQYTSADRRTLPPREGRSRSVRSHLHSGTIVTALAETEQSN